MRYALRADCSAASGAARRPGPPASPPPASAGPPTTPLRASPGAPSWRPSAARGRPSAAAHGSAAPASVPRTSLGPPLASSSKRASRARRRRSAAAERRSAPPPPPAHSAGSPRLLAPARLSPAPWKRTKRARRSSRPAPARALAGHAGASVASRRPTSPGSDPASGWGGRGAPARPASARPLQGAAGGQGQRGAQLCEDSASIAGGVCTRFCARLHARSKHCRAGHDRQSDAQQQPRRRRAPHARKLVVAQGKRRDRQGRSEPRLARRPWRSRGRQPRIEQRHQRPAQAQDHQALARRRQNRRAVAAAAAARVLQRARKLKPVSTCTACRVPLLFVQALQQTEQLALEVLETCESRCRLTFRAGPTAVLAGPSIRDASQLKEMMQDCRACTLSLKG